MPDGASASLVGVLVREVNPDGSFTVREGWSDAFTLSVIPAGPVEISPLQTVDVSGTILTFNGKRQLNASSVRVYTDSAGSIISTPLPVRTAGGSLLPWQWKDDAHPAATLSPAGMMSAMNAPSYSSNSSALPEYCATIAAAKALYSPAQRMLVELHCRSIQNPSASSFTLLEDTSSDTITVYCSTPLMISERINKLTGAIQRDANGNFWIEVDAGPNWLMGAVKGGVQSTAEGSIAWAKTWPDSTLTPLSLSNKVVSRIFPLQGYYYIQESGGSSGIRVYDPAMVSSVTAGDLVDITGGISTDDGERLIIPTATVIQGQAVLRPLSMISRSVSGSAFNQHTPGAHDGQGLNNVGLLIKLSGRVTDIGLNGIKISDGSYGDDGVTKGIWVEGYLGYHSYTPTLGDFVSVVGVSSLTNDYTTNNLMRIIRVSSSHDLVVVKYSGTPTEVEVQPSGADTNGKGKLIIYWKAVPGAIGYNIYRGTTSGGEDYQNPINGNLLWNNPSYAGSVKMAYTDTNLNLWQEYFYTVKAITTEGESVASDEDSDMPDDLSIPWDSDDAYLITNAVANL